MGPLEGVKIVEFAGIGPGPHCCMLLADMGADVVRVDRAANVGKPTVVPDKFNNLTRNRPNIALDLKHPKSVEILIESKELEMRHGSGIVAVTFPHGRGRVVHVLGHFFQKEGNLRGTVAMQRILLNFLYQALRSR